MCRSLISHPGCAACLQRGLLCSWPFKRTQPCAVCCKSESVSTACIALFQSPAICHPPSPVLCGAMCSALALLVTALEQCLPSTHTRTHNAAYRCTGLDFHMQTRPRWGFVSLEGGGSEAHVQRDKRYSAHCVLPTW